MEELKSIAQSYEIYADKLKDIENRARFGYQALDEMIPGLLPGQMTVIAGGTSMGKTTFLANCAYNMAYRQKRRVLFASLESGHSVSKPITMLAGETTTERLSIYAPKGQVSLNNIYRLVKNNIEACEVLIIDHIHYLANAKTSNYSATIGELTRNIQLMAVELHIAVVVVAHVRKLSSETAVPSLNDLKDSSALYQDPSTVIIIHRFKNESENLINNGDRYKQKFSNKGALLVEKNRDFGYTGVLGLEFNPQTLQFAVGGEWIEPDTKP